MSRQALSPIGRNAATIVLLSVFMIGPLLTTHWINVGESYEQMMRVVEMARGIRDGDLYPRWCGDFAGGFGSPYFVFYSPLIYFISAAIHLLGFDVITALKLMIVLGVITAGIGMYVLANIFWGPHGAVVSAVAYVYVPYRAVNLYIRGDFAEAFAMSLLPWIMYFFHRCMMQQNRLWMMGAALSYAALIFTHNCTALTFSGFLAFFILFLSAQHKDGTALGRGILAVVWGLALSAVFWLPALWEKAWVNIELIYANKAFDFHYNFPDLFRFLSTTWTLDEGMGGRNLPFQIGTPHIILAVVSMVSVMKLDKAEGQRLRELSLFFLFSFAGVLYLATASSVIVWESLPLMKYIQFPWRLLSLLSVIVSLLCGGLFVGFRRESRALQQILQIALVLVIVHSGAPFCRVKGYYIMSEAQKTTAFIRQQGGTASSYNMSGMRRIRDYGEYLPKTVAKLPDKRTAGKVSVTDGRAEIKDLETRLQAYAFRVAAEVDTEITIGSFYYPSWTGRVDGKAIPLYTDPEGLIHLRVPEGTHHVHVFFDDTTIRKVSGYTSLLSLLLPAIFLLLNRIKRSPRKGSRT